jgi:hypothetical protein
MDEIVSARDSENNPDQELPPTMPKHVMGLRFRGLTNRGGAGVAVLEAECRHLKAAYDSGGLLTDTIDSFDEDKADFDVATVFPGTPPVEADFSEDVVLVNISTT